VIFVFLVVSLRRIVRWLGPKSLLKLGGRGIRVMRKVAVHVAKTQLLAALAGEEVVTAKGDKPVVRLVAIPRGKFKLGVLKRGALGSVRLFLPDG